MSRNINYSENRNEVLALAQVLQFHLLSRALSDRTTTDIQHTTTNLRNAMWKASNKTLDSYTINKIWMRIAITSQNWR